MSDERRRRIVEIVVYPIKSTAGISVDACDVDARGLAMDRRWMVVDEHGEFLSGREIPQLTQIRAHIDNGGLRLAAPTGDALHVPLPPASTRRRTVRVWNDECPAAGAGPSVDAWLSRVLDTPCHLVYMDDASRRPVDPDFGRPGDLVSFADGYPLLVISSASLEDLNTRLAEPVSMRRFRPNLVVDGCTPYEEDGWVRMRAGDVLFDGVKSCARCVFTTIDPDNGEPHPRLEPLRTLGDYRRAPGGGVLFGRNLIPRSLGRVRIGDVVEVETTPSET